MSFPHIQICILFPMVHTVMSLYGALQYWKNMESYLCQFCSRITKGRKGELHGNIDLEDKLQSSCSLLFFTRLFLLFPFHNGKNRQLRSNKILSILHCVMENTRVQESEDHLIPVISVSRYVTLGNPLLSSPELPHQTLEFMLTRLSLGSMVLWKKQGLL